MGSANTTLLFIPKNRRKALYGEPRRELGVVFRELARQRESEIEEGHLMPDHVHMHDLNPAEVTRYRKWSGA